MHVTVSTWATLVTIIGGAQPLVVSMLKQSAWPKQVNVVIAMAFSAVAGLVTVASQGDLDLAQWATTAAAIYAVASVTYQHVWQPLKVTSTIQNATDVAAPAPTTPDQLAPVADDPETGEVTDAPTEGP